VLSSGWFTVSVASLVTSPSVTVSTVLVVVTVLADVVTGLASVVGPVVAATCACTGGSVVNVSLR